MRELLGVGYYEPGGFSTELNMLRKNLRDHGMDVKWAARTIVRQTPN